MAVTVDAYGSRHWLGIEAGNGLHVHVLTGLVIMSSRGDGSLSWVHDTLTFEVPLPDLPAGQGLKVVQWAPYVALASIANEGPPLSVGWAVDGFRLLDTGAVITTATVACDLAVRDPGSFLYRLAYSLHLTGQHEALP